MHEYCLAARTPGTGSEAVTPDRPHALQPPGCNGAASWHRERASLCGVRTLTDRATTSGG